MSQRGRQIVCLIWVAILIGLLIFIFFTTQVQADVCYASRTINQWYCSATGDEICLQTHRECAGPEPIGGQSCTVSGNSVYGYCNCVTVCDRYNASQGSGGICSLANPIYGSCNQANCSVNATVRNCRTVSGICNEYTEQSSLACWGPGNLAAVCGNSICETSESCSSCPADCSCAVYCGDGVCNGAESCNSCVSDCGVCATPFCDQTSCGVFCSDQDAGVPAVPGNLTPVDGQTVMPNSANAVTLSWSTVPKADIYQVRIYPLGTEEAQKCTAAFTKCSGAITATNFTFPVDAGVGTYLWEVRALNNSCSAAEVGAWSTPLTIHIAGNIAGSFYLDSDRQAAMVGNLCQTTANLPAINPGAGAAISAGLMAGNITDTQYTISNVPATANTLVSLQPNNQLYECVCPAGCHYSGLSAPLSNVNFYLDTARLAWWQTINGLIYAGQKNGTALSSQIPTSCVLPNCLPALSLQNTTGAPNSEGYAISGGGRIDSPLRQDGQAGQITNQELHGAREDYHYFISLFSIGKNPTSDSLDGAKPTAPPQNQRAYYLANDLNIQTPWAVNANETLVIFVSGNLNVNEKIQVAEGGFLAFIVQGNIVFAATLGQIDSKSILPVTEGVYIADGQIIVQGRSDGGGDSKFVGAGTFVAWNGFLLNRHYQPTVQNNTSPTELFIYRPDFILSVPPRMTRPYQLWQEIN